MAIDRRTFLIGGAAGVAALALAGRGWWAPSAEAKSYPVSFSPAEWKKRLTPWQYAVLREKSTEHPFSSALDKEKRAGTYACAGCAQQLFSSRTKYDSGTGWPSFWQPLRGAVGTDIDYLLGYARTEVHCARCGGHLGHVFDDGPRPTGKRYCMNGVAMKFMPGKA